MAKTMSYDHLIIGASAAGLAAAEAIRKASPDATILMVSAESHEPYGRPLISYALEGKTTEAHMALRKPGYFEEQRITCGFGPDYMVASLDADAHTATFANGKRVRYGTCLVASGSTPFVPETPGIDGAENVFGFLTLDDANAVLAGTQKATRAAHDEGRKSRLVVSGAGLTGMKAAEALSYHVDDVVVVGHNRRLLKNALDDGGTAVLKRLIESAHNVECRTGCAVEAAVREGDRVVAVQLSDGTELACDVLVMAVGVRPATALAAAAGATVELGIVVDGCLRTSLADVYAAGDCIQVSNLLTGKQEVQALWGNAVRQGRIAGMQMAGAEDAPSYAGDIAENAVDFFDISLLSCGIVNPGDADGCEETITQTDTEYAKFVTRDDALVGYVLINRPDHAGIYNSMIRNHVPVSQMVPEAFAREPQLMDLPADLRKRYMWGDE